MEKNDLKAGVKETLLTATLQKELEALKEAIEVKNLRERIISKILVEQDKAKLEQVESKLQEVLSAKRLPPVEGGITNPGQGNT